MVKKPPPESHKDSDHFLLDIKTLLQTLAFQAVNFVLQQIFAAEKYVPTNRTGPQLLVYMQQQMFLQCGSESVPLPTNNTAIWPMIGVFPYEVLYQATFEDETFPADFAPVRLVTFVSQYMDSEFFLGDK